MDEKTLPPLQWPRFCTPVEQTSLWVGEIPLYDWQIQVLNAAMQLHSRVIAGTPNESGKPQPERLIIPTPKGDMRFGDLKQHDYVFDRQGKPTRITQVFERGEQEVFKITFDNGEVSTLATADHLWWYMPHDMRFSKWRREFNVFSTRDIMDQQRSRLGPQNRGVIPACRPVEYKEKRFLLHPYMLGVLLGDGCLTSRSITFTSVDPEIIDRVNVLLPKGYALRRTGQIGYGIRHDWLLRDYSSNGVADEIQRLGLLKTHSDTKFIPPEYLQGSVEQRIELLRGLMDTDGTISKERCHTTYTTVSKRLALDIMTLVRSLGGKAMMRSRYTQYRAANGDKKTGKKSYRVAVKLPDINPFHLSRKAERWYPISIRPERLVYSIEPVGRMKCRCIKVDSPDHSYLTNDFIVTHNTSVLAPIFLFSVMAAFPGAFCFATSASETQVQEQLFEANLIPTIEKFPQWRYTKKPMKIFAPNGSTLLCYKCAKAENVEGFHGKWDKDNKGKMFYRPCAYFLDESKAIADDVHFAVRRIDPDFMLAVSTPGAMSGWFYDGIDPDNLEQVIEKRKRELDLF